MGPLYVGQALRDAGYPVRVMNLTGDLAERRQTLVEAVSSQEPLFVGFSTVLAPRLAYDVALSRMLHEMGIRVVWGGVFASAVPEAPAREEYIDYVVVGEGEIPVVRLAEAIEAGALAAGIPGVAYRDHGEVIMPPPAPPEENLDSHRFGADLIDWTPYIMDARDHIGRKLSLPFSRGCPFRCSFCYNCALAGTQAWRVHSVEYLEELIAFFRDQYGVESFFFAGDNAFGHVARGKRTIEQLRGIRWNGSVHPRCVDAEFLDWAEDNGCFGLALGFESGSDRILKAMNKASTADLLRDCARLFAERKLAMLASFMGFMPGETPADLEQTLALMEDVHNLKPRCEMKFHVYRAYPGTEYWQASIDLGLVPPVDLEEWASYRPEIVDYLGYPLEVAMQFRNKVNRLYRRDVRGYAGMALERMVLRSELAKMLKRFAAAAGKA